MKPDPERTSESRLPGPFELRFRSLLPTRRLAAGVGGRETGALQAARFGLAVVAASGLAFAIARIRADQAQDVLALAAARGQDAAPVHDAAGANLTAADRVDGRAGAEGEGEDERNQSKTCHRGLLPSEWLRDVGVRGESCRGIDLMGPMPK